MKKIRFNKNTPLLEVDKPVIGKLYHVAWSWSRGCVWRCSAINEQKKTVTLITPKTKKVLENIKISDLRLTRKDQTKLLGTK